jgi:hypothetical protein
MCKSCLESCFCVGSGEIDVPGNELDGGRERLHNIFGGLGRAAPSLVPQGVPCCVNRDELAIGHLASGTGWYQVSLRVQRVLGARGGVKICRGRGRDGRRRFRIAGRGHHGLLNDIIGVQHPQGMCQIIGSGFNTRLEARQPVTRVLILKGSSARFSNLRLFRYSTCCGVLSRSVIFEKKNRDSAYRH